MALQAIFQISFILLLVLAQARLGELIAVLIYGPTNLSEHSSKSAISKIALPLGIAVSLTELFFLQCAGLKLSAASILLLLPLLIKPTELANTVKLFIPKPSLNFLLWLFVILALGISLFDATGDIQTLWVNNYGDLTFHLGMITNFVFGRDFPPEYHLFAGESLSYPFFINLWSAALWWLNPTFNALHLIFVVQWALLWMVIYRAVDGSKNLILPWAILFGGGSYFYFNLASGELIKQGHLWTTFISTIWVTQRTALFGAAMSLSALALFNDSSKSSCRTGLWGCNPYVACAGLLLALSPLIHTHIALVTTLFIGLVTLSSLLKERSFRELLSFVTPFLIALLFLPWLLGKGGMVTFYDGWGTPSEHYLFQDLLNALLVPKFIGDSVSYWLSEVPQLLFVLTLVWLITKRHQDFILVILLFFLGNYIKLASWEWDQIKYFLGLYLVLIALIASSEKMQRWYIQSLLILLIVPAVIETGSLLGTAKKFTIYTKSEIQQALGLRAATDHNSIVMAAPAHNSPVTLSGRQMFYGYEGTLHSHAIDYRARKQLFDGFDGAIKCGTSVSEQQRQYCPTHLFWTNRETTKWPDKVPVKYPEISKTSEPYLYIITALPRSQRE